jgi:glyceraldehyde-3-phosphate dehydrogenase [NAD(P)+]
MSVIARVATPSVGEVEGAVHTVYTRGRWTARDLPGERRVRVLRRVADLLEKNAELFEEFLVLNTGKTRQQARGK